MWRGGLGGEYKIIAIMRHEHIECKRRVMPHIVDPARVTLNVTHLRARS